LAVTVGLLGILAPARAQEMPETVHRDLWCGLALTLLAEDAPADATDEQRALAARFAEGGTMLTDRARAALLETGLSDDALDRRTEQMREAVADAVNRATAEPAYSFEECAALLPS
jgi:hypothetical protein